VRHRLALAAAAALAILAACGDNPGGSSRPSAAPASPTASSAGGGSSKELLFAVLEPGGDLTAMRDNTVAIVRMDGTAKAKARFDPRQLPRVGNALPLPQPEARVAAGRVYFADGAGAVRSLAVDGSVTSVASFPLTGPQQLLSFAVSPDGGQLLAALFGFPPVHVPPPQTPIDPPFGPGDFTLQLLTARAGQSVATLSRRNWPQSAGPPRDVLSIVGWSRYAPLATIDTSLGTQQGSLGRQMFGHVAELDTAGRPGPPLGGYSCDAWSALPDETVLCDEDGQLRNFSVRGKDGSVRFRVHATGDAQYLHVHLAPDASRVAYLVNGGRAAVTDAAGKSVQLPASFRPEGWLDSSTVVGVLQTAQGEGDMALVQLDRPTRLRDLGFKGFFAGVVQG
jgi:hypothetical protein